MCISDVSSGFSMLEGLQYLMTNTIKPGKTSLYQDYQNMLSDLSRRDSIRTVNIDFSIADRQLLEAAKHRKKNLVD